LLRDSLQNHCRGLLKRRRLGQLARDLAWYAATTRRLPPIGFRSALRRRMRREPARPRFPDWLSPDFCQRASLTDRWADYHRPREQTTPRGVVQKQLSSPYWASVFDRYDASWTGSPLEVRHPLMDVRLVTFLAGLPAVPWCVHKELFRRHLKCRVPREVHERPKTVLADDPVRVKLARQGVPWKEDTELESEMGGFVNQAALPRYQCHMTVNELYHYLRPYSLNQWLKSRNLRKDSCPIMAKAI
jgi:asparagine synthase (glutamine-hydrolysing)